MNRKRDLTLIAAVLFLAALACGETGKTASTPTAGNSSRTQDGSTVSRGNRILELDANPPQVNDYDRVMDQVHKLGADSVRLTVYWDEIETSPGIYKPDPNWLAVANSYYPAQGLQVSLVIAVLDTTETRLPHDLEGKSLDDPLVIKRFNSLLDYVAGQIPELTLTSLAIGNEIDGVLGADPAAWKAYTDFFIPAAEKAHTLFPGVPVGAKVMYDGLASKAVEQARALNQQTDVVMTTYYPLENDFTVRDPTVIQKDFDRLVDHYPEREIHITEIGYPTSKKNDSSPEKQAAFIREMFRAWDEHQEQITLISYTWLHDLPPSTVSDFKAYYGVSNSAFGEFLRTLGLRSYPGQGENKVGFEVFRQEAAARGWE